MNTTKMTPLSAFVLLEAWHSTNRVCLRAGKLHFVKFETQRIDDCIDFIEAKGLHRTHNGAGQPEGKVRVVATGGGAYKYAERFQVGQNSSSQCCPTLTSASSVASCRPPKQLLLSHSFLYTLSLDIQKLTGARIPSTST